MRQVKFVMSWYNNIFIAKLVRGHVPALWQASEERRGEERRGEEGRGGRKDGSEKEVV